MFGGGGSTGVGITSGNKGLGDFGLGGGRASGGEARGWTLVGENGPELAYFGQQGHVLNAARTRDALATRREQSSAPTHVHFHGIRDSHDIRRSQSQISAHMANQIAMGNRNR